MRPIYAVHFVFHLKVLFLYILFRYHWFVFSQAKRMNNHSIKYFLCRLTKKVLFYAANVIFYHFCAQPGVKMNFFEQIYRKWRANWKNISAALVWKSGIQLSLYLRITRVIHAKNPTLDGVWNLMSIKLTCVCLFIHLNVQNSFGLNSPLKPVVVLIFHVMCMSNGHEHGLEGYQWITLGEGKISANTNQIDECGQCCEFFLCDWFLPDLTKFNHFPCHFHLWKGGLVDQASSSGSELTASISSGMTLPWDHSTDSFLEQVEHPVGPLDPFSEQERPNNSIDVNLIGFWIRMRLILRIKSLRKTPWNN